jgi:hypothetical protein
MPLLLGAGSSQARGGLQLHLSPALRCVAHGDPKADDFWGEEEAYPGPKAIL